VELDPSDLQPYSAVAVIEEPLADCYPRTCFKAVTTLDSFLLQKSCRLAIASYSWMRDDSLAIANLQHFLKVIVVV